MAGGRIKESLGRVTGNRIMALAFGVLVTMILQSSSATTVMLVSLAGTQLLNLTQAFGVILGADIGTTFVVVLLSVQKIADYALFIIASGVAVQWIGKRSKTKYLGAVILGFGLIFFGMHLMAHSTAPLKDDPIALNIFAYISTHPLFSLIVATIFTAFIHASAATIGMAISLSFSGLISFEAAIPIVLGANVGTCITAFMACFGMGVDAKRVAVAHTLVKVVGVAIAFPFIKQVTIGINYIAREAVVFVPGITVSDAGKIALTHLLFNVAVALLFLPFIGLGVRLVKKLVPEPMFVEEMFGPRYLDDKMLDTPILAFAQAKRETIRVAGYAFDLFKDCLHMFERGSNIQDMIEDVQNKDDKIDILEKAIRFYLAKISQEQLSEDQAKWQYKLINVAGNIEEIGDIISKDIVMLAKKKWNKNRIFSEEGWKELRHFHNLVTENFNLTITAIASPYPEVTQKIVRNQNVIYELEQEYRQAHINRLYEGMKETFETSSIHLDLLSNLRRINGQLTYIAKVVSEES